MRKKDPWTDPDPQRGDFDEWLATADPEDIEIQIVTPGSNIEVIEIDTNDVDSWLRKRGVERKKQVRADSSSAHRRSQNRP